MAEQKEVICPSCARAVSVDADTAELFCPYCGRRFVSGAEKASGSEDRERLSAAFMSGDYARVVRETYDGVGETDPALGMLRTAASCFAAREKYFADALELDSKRTAKGSFARLFLGRDEYAENPMHKQWFSDTESLCSALADEISGSPELSALGGALALAVTRSMLAKKSEKKDKPLYWPAAAVEHFCIPLLPHIATGELRALSEEYAGYYKRYERLPNQERVLAAIMAELASR